MLSSLRFDLVDYDVEENIILARLAKFFVLRCSTAAYSTNVRISFRFACRLLFLYSVASHCFSPNAYALIEHMRIDFSYSDCNSHKELENL